MKKVRGEQALSVCREQFLSHAPIYPTTCLVFYQFRHMSDTTTVHSRVLSVTPVMGKGTLLALAAAEIAVAGVVFTLHGIQVIRKKEPPPIRRAHSSSLTGILLALNSELSSVNLTSDTGLELDPKNPSRFEFKIEGYI